MVVAAFPLAKIGLLFLKQLSKPLANVIKNEAKKHATIRKYVIIPIGRVYGWTETRMEKIKGSHVAAPLTEEECVELGANAIGEICLFGMLSIILMAEYNRQGDKKAVIEKTKEEEVSNLIETVLDVIEQVEKVKYDVQKIKRDIEIASDVIELEEQRHSFVEDHNFWDIMANRSKKVKRKKAPDDGVRAA